MKVTPRERRNLTLIGLGILLVLIWGIGIQPWLEAPLVGGERQALLIRAREAERLLGQAGTIEARHRALSAAVEEAKRNYSAATEPTAAAVELFRLIEDFAAASDLHLRSRGLRTPVTKEDPPRLRIELEASGRPAAVVGFLDRVRRSPRRFGLERLELVPEEGERLRLYALLVTLLPEAKGGAP
ncbi:MAG: M55 family metallopeptidase [Firmicutes bacterium]|nr:M55 family metallopeptidase [Bacillota bacterium]